MYAVHFRNQCLHMLITSTNKYMILVTRNMKYSRGFIVCCFFKQIKMEMDSIGEGHQVTVQ